MTIYGEFLFLENALSGAVILMLTGRLCGYRRDGRSAFRVTAGSIMCGAYAFILFVNMHWLVALLSKLAFSCAAVWLVFRPETRKSFLKTTAVFYIVSFLMGGITIAIMYMTGSPGMASNGSVYLYGINYLQIMTGIVITAVTGVWLAEHLKEKVHKETVMMEAEIHIGGHCWQVKALIDTGNFLSDPVSGYPAAVISSSVGRQILRSIGQESSKRCCLIPYRTIGKKGMMYGLRPDYVLAEGQELRKLVLAFSEEDFDPWKGSVNYDMLLNQHFFEGRI